MERALNILKKEIAKRRRSTSDKRFMDILKKELNM
jgi:hypothetical protein